MCVVALARQRQILSPLTVAHLVVTAILLAPSLSGAGALVLQTDFGTRDGAVAAMTGVAVGVDPRLPIHDLTHEIEPFNIWEGAFCLKQAAPYWPAGTVFVSVVDPGVGTERKAIVLQTRSGHFFVSPDNGTLTLVADELGVAAVREIDTTRHRRAGSAASHTFHGRDIFAYTGARLAAGSLAFADVGPELAGDLVRLDYARARREGDVLIGNIPALDVRYGNVWTNIPQSLFAALEPTAGDRFRVSIFRGRDTVFTGEMPYVHTFGDVPEGAPLLYLNSLLDVSLALNLRNFAQQHGIAAGAEWAVRIERAGGG